MKRPPPSARVVWATLLPTAGMLLALALTAHWPNLAYGTPGRMGPGFLFLLVLAGAAAACHRPPLGGATLGLGAVILPSALTLSGALPTASLAAAAFLIAELLHRLVRRSKAVQLPERRRLVRALESTGRVALATLAAGIAWRFLEGPAAGRPGWTLPALAAASLGVYLLSWIVLEAADRWIRGLDLHDYLLPILVPPLLDAAAWGLGTALVAAGRSAGWTVGGLLLAGFGALALEAARNALLSELSDEKVADLEKVRRAADGMIGGGQEIGAVVEQIFTQCREVVDAQWLQFELSAAGTEPRSWWSGPRGGLGEGAPEPDRHPPALPGVHRRQGWEVLERPLAVDNVRFGRLRLWCDPRKLEPESVHLLERLLPQMGASVERSLLDRQAREDPLTGVAVRRVLERRLHEVHAHCLEEGGSMAVVMCDLDHFKRINDTYGHAVGDEALIAVSAVLKSDLRDSDLCCRYGGEEFTLLLGPSTGAQALAIADRLRQRVEALDFRVDGERLPLAVSAGVAAFPELHVKTASELLLLADEALYEAKRRGRNRCLLDQGQGSYLDPQGQVEHAEIDRPVQEPPRIFV